MLGGDPERVTHLSLPADIDRRERRLEPQTSGDAGASVLSQPGRLIRGHMLGHAEDAEKTR